MNPKNVSKSAFQSACMKQKVSEKISIFSLTDNSYHFNGLNFKATAISLD